MSKRSFEVWVESNSYPWETREDAKKRYEARYGPVPEENAFLPVAKYGTAFIVLCVMLSILIITSISELYDRFLAEYVSYGVLR